MTSRRVRLIAIVVALAAVLAWFLWRRGSGDDTTPIPTATVTAGTEDPGSTTSGGGGGATAPPALGPSKARLQQGLDDYLRVAVYPPWSRPHDEGTAYKLAWNDPVVSDLPFMAIGDREVKFRFAADRAQVGFGEALTSWVEVWEASKPAELLPAKIVQAWVMSNASDKQGRTVPLTYSDDGKHRYTNRFVPSEHDELASAQQVRIMAEVEVEGEHRSITRDFTYTPRPVLEVLAIRDAVVGGSLVITLDVEVFEPGIHTIEANVLAADGDPAIAYVDTSSTLAVGKTSVELTFFGKVFRDLAIDGPYVIVDLRGFRRDIDSGENLYWSDPRTHTTPPYPHTDFSDAEWESEEKTEKIKAFQQLIDQTP